MASSVKIILKKEKINKAGYSPLYLRITVNRQSCFFSLGYTVKEADWDSSLCKVKKTYPNFKQINAFINRKISNAETILLESESRFQKVNLQYVKEKLTGGSFNDFFTYVDQIIINDTTKAISTINGYKTAIAKLRLFQKSKPLKFSEITISFLERYEKFLREVLGNKANTIINNLKLIRKSIKRAVAEKLINYDEDPFLYFKVKKEKGTKTSLTEKEIRSIENLSLNQSKRIFDVRSLFLFSYYSAGIRVSDSLQIRFKNIVEGKLQLRTQKTGRLIAIKLGNKALAIIQHYQKENSSPNDFVFPFFKSNKDYSIPKILHKEISGKTSLINKYLKKIQDIADINDKNLSSHVARHTFATTCLEKDVPIKVVSDLMGHSSVKTTEIYIHSESYMHDEYMVKISKSI